MGRVIDPEDRVVDVEEEEALQEHNALYTADLEDFEGLLGDDGVAGGSG